MATMLAVDLLGCTGTNEERACLFHKMILIAAELKSNMGNMFGFAAVMRALELPQVGTTPHFKTHFALFAEKHCIYEAKLDSKNLDLRLTFLSCCFFLSTRCPGWSRPGSHYGSDTQRALFFTRRP